MIALAWIACGGDDASLPGTTTAPTSEPPIASTTGDPPTPTDTPTTGDPPEEGPPPLTGPAFADCTTDAPWSADNGTLSAVFVDLAEHPLARCNDGSPGLYYVIPGGNDWLVYLDGGSLCKNHATCVARWCDGLDPYDHTDMSSVGAPANKGLAGVFGDQPANPFFGWTRVYVHYCSSDLWSGHTEEPVELQDTGSPTGEGDYTIYFNGNDILHGVLNELFAPTRRAELSEMPPATDIGRFVFAGGSAGGVGTIWNGDAVAERVLATAPSADVTLGVVAGLGQGLQASTDPWGPLDAPDTLIDAIQGQWGMKSLAEDALSPAKYNSQIDATCIANHPDDGWWCGDPIHVLTHAVSTPFFVIQDQLDPVWLGNLDDAVDGGDGPLAGQIQGDSWAEQVRDLTLHWDDITSPDTPSAYVDGGRPVGFYVPRCMEHDGYPKNANLFYDYTVPTLDGDASLASLWGAFLVGETARGLTLADDVPDCGP